MGTTSINYYRHFYVVVIQISGKEDRKTITQDTFGIDVSLMQF